MPDLIPTRSALAQIEAGNQKLIDYLTRQEASLQKKLEMKLANEEINYLFPDEEADGNVAKHPLKEAIDSIPVVDEHNKPVKKNAITSYGRSQQITAVIQQIQDEISNLEEANKAEVAAIQAQQSALNEETSEIQNQINDLNITAASDEPEVELESIQLQIEEKALRLKEISLELEELDIENSAIQKPIDTKKNHVEMLENALQRISEKQQEEENKITALQNFRTRLLTDENKKILDLKKNNAKKAQELAAIHDKTRESIPDYDTRVKEEIERQLDSIQKQRTELLTTVETKTSRDNAYIDLQSQMASLSANNNGPTTRQRTSNQSFDKDARDKLLKDLKTKKSFKHKGREFFHLPDGGTQAAQGDVISTKMLIDLQFSKINKANENAPIKAPLDLFLVKGSNTSDETINAAAQHALAMGGNDIEIVDPDENGDQWNEIFKVKANLKPTENDTKIFSATAQSNFALLITELQYHKKPDQLILKVLSALGNKQLVEVIDDLTAAAQDGIKKGNNDAETFLNHVLSLLPKTLDTAKPEFVNALYGDLKNIEPESIQAEAIKAYILHNLQKTSNRFLGMFNMHNKVAQDTLQPLKTNVLGILEKPVFDSLIEKIDDLDERNINPKMRDAIKATLTQFCPKVQQEMAAEQEQQRQANQRRLAAEPVEEEQNENSDDDDDDKLDSEDDDIDEEKSVKDTDEERLRKKPTKNKADDDDIDEEESDNDDDDDDDDDELDSKDEDDDDNDDDDDTNEEDDAEKVDTEDDTKKQKQPSKNVTHHHNDDEYEEEKAENQTPSRGFGHSS